MHLLQVKDRHRPRLKGQRRRTLAEHIEQCVGILAIPSNHYRLRSEPLRLSRLLHKGTTTSLYQCNPCVRGFGFVWPTDAEFRAAVDGIGLKGVARIACAGRTRRREGQQRDHIAKQGVRELGAEGCRACGEGDGRGAVDDGDGAVGGPRPTPEPAAVVAGARVELAEPVDGMRGGVGEEGRGKGEDEEDVDHGECAEACSRSLVAAQDIEHACHFRHRSRTSAAPLQLRLFSDSGQGGSGCDCSRWKTQESSARFAGRGAAALAGSYTQPKHSCRQIYVGLLPRPPSVLSPS